MRCAQFLEQPRVLDGDHGLLRESFDQRYLLVGEWPNLLPIDGNNADQLVFLQHRHNDDTASTGNIGHLNNVWSAREVRRALSHVFDLHGLMGSDDDGLTAFRMRTDHPVFSQSREGQRHIVIRSRSEILAVPQIHHAEIRPTDPRGILEHFLEHRFQFAGRGADDLKNLGGCRLLLQRFREVARARLHLVEQPNVADGDDGLIGKGLQQLDMVIVEAAWLCPRNRNEANGLAVAKQGNAQQTAPTTQPRQFPRGGLGCKFDFWIDNSVRLAFTDGGHSELRQRRWERGLQYSIGRRIDGRECHQVHQVADQAVHCGR